MDEYINSTTFTVCNSEHIPVGSRIKMSTPDRRWWRRLWFFVLRKGYPTIDKYAQVTGNDGATMITVEPSID